MTEKAWPVLHSQRRELARVVHWLRSHRFTQDFEMGAVAEHAAKLIEDGTYEKDTESTRTASGADPAWMPAPALVNKGEGQ